MPEFPKKPPQQRPQPMISSKPSHSQRPPMPVAGKANFQQRPVIRPTAPPQKIMPKTPPPPVKVIPTRPGLPPRPRPGSVSSQTQRPIPGVATHSTIRPQAVVMNAAAGLIALNISRAHQDLSSDIGYLNNALMDLQEKSTFNSVISDLNTLETRFTEAFELLDSAKVKGYGFLRNIELSINELKGKWDSIRNQVFQQAQNQSQQINNRLPTLNPQIQQLNNYLANPATARPVIQSLQNQINTISSSISQIEDNIELQYKPIIEELQLHITRLKNIHWSLDQLTKACFKLNPPEQLINAVAARWDKEGNEDPEGILYLTDSRIVFERNEKVAKKKILFITTESELVQEVLVDQPINTIDQVTGDKKGLFGNQDFLIITFGKTIGTVPFHINGQTGKDWNDSIQKVKSGSIEKERSTGNEISINDMTAPITSASIVNMQNEVGAIQDELMLKNAQTQLADLENELQSLYRQLSDVRARGYVIEKNLEGDIAILNAQWGRIKQNADKTLQMQTTILAIQSNELQQAMASLAGMINNLNAARPVYLQLKSSMASAKSQAEAAEETVLAQFDQYRVEVEALSSHLEWVDWMLDALATASFQLLATESGVAATEAVWMRPDGLEPENGILFLTDQRLLWEDRVGDFELKFNSALSQVEKLDFTVDEASGQEILKIGFQSGAPYPTGSFLLSMPMGEEWVQMINRARSGEYADNRSEEIDPAELEKVKNAPQQCTKCGASITAPVLRGQTEVHCEYCGNVMRL